MRDQEGGQGEGADKGCWGTRESSNRKALPPRSERGTRDTASLATTEEGLWLGEEEQRAMNSPLFLGGSSNAPCKPNPRKAISVISTDQPLCIKWTEDKMEEGVSSSRDKCKIIKTQTHESTKAEQTNHLKSPSRTLSRPHLCTYLNMLFGTWRND